MEKFVGGKKVVEKPVEVVKKRQKGGLFNVW